MLDQFYSEIKVSQAKNGYVIQHGKNRTEVSVAKDLYELIEFIREYYEE